MSLVQVALASGSQAVCWLLLAWAAATGAALGSFVGLVVARLPRHESVVWPRSRCGACRRVLAALDLVPVLSWLCLAGRCRRCRAWIGIRPLWLELAMASLSVALMLRFGPSWALVTHWPLFVALLAIALLDIDWFWVPDALSAPALGWALATAWLPGNIGGRAAFLGLVPALSLWAFAEAYARLLGREGVGLGDVKLLAVMGAFLGAVGCLLALCLASVLGTLVGALVLLRGCHVQAAQGDAVPAALADDDWTPPKSAIPFGPFLVLASYAVVLAPPDWPSRLCWWPAELIGRMG
jgi:leader peptidase (prepilin peptidase)/N-methyltransferase